MYFQPTLVTKDFYEAVKKTIPEAISETRYARFLDYLLFSNFHDEDTGYKVTPEKLLADIEGMAHRIEGKSRNYGRATKFPIEFEEATGLSLHRLPYRFKDGRASAYAIKNLPLELQKAFEAELLNPAIELKEGVYLEGNLSNAASIQSQQKQKFIDAKSNHIEEFRHDVNFLNSSSRKSRFLDRNAEKRRFDALAIAAKVGDASKRGQLERKIINLPTFEPFYEAKDNTTRIYTRGISLQNLPEGVRKAILTPSKNYDLSAAQLAIMSTHWQVSELQDLISQGDVWPTLCKSLGIPTWNVKGVKRLVYSAAFGMTEGNLALSYGKLLGQVDDETSMTSVGVEKTIQHYSSILENNTYLGSLLLKRSEARRRIQETKKAVDAHGNLHNSWDFSTSMEGGHKIRTMMAFEMQSREMWLMEPIIEIAQENEGKMLITLWIHDGVYVHYYKADRSQKLEREMIRRVNNRAMEAGYPTKLELVQKTT